MKILKACSISAYQEILKQHKCSLDKLSVFENELSELVSNEGEQLVTGMSWPSGGASQFLIDDMFSEGERLNFRERLVCQQTALNNRVRGAIHVFESEFKPNSKDQIYVTEQISPFYQWLIKKYPLAKGSEYLVDVPWRIRLRLMVKALPQMLVHQDITDLKYKQNSLDFVLSFDCLEHVPNYKEGLKEVCKALKIGGVFLFSVPFDVNAKKNLVRASLDQNGKVVYHMPPEYHGNPLSASGSLSYYTFGWEILDELKSAGFSEAYALVYWSEEYLYLGGPQLLLCGIK